MTTAKIKNGAENIKWDLTTFYRGPQDPSITKDVQTLERLSKAFYRAYKGHLNTKLGPALTALSKIQKLSTRVSAYFALEMSRRASDQSLKSASSFVSEKLAEQDAHYLTFFSLEVGELSATAYQKQLSRDPVVAHHKPMLDHIRQLAKYHLTEDVEKSLSLYSPFGAPEWDDLLEEVETELVFEGLGDQKTLTLSELLHHLVEEQSSDVRATLLKRLNDGLKAQKHDRFRARALNVVMGQKMILDKQRGYAHSMAARNLRNQVDDATVNALHDAVLTEGARQAKRYYQLFAKLLKKKKLLWSDRNAPLPDVGHCLIPWSDAMDTVKKAYASFSPTLVRLIEDIEQNDWIDAPTYQGKIGGAYNYSMLLPDGARSYNLLNYQGSVHDVSTLAHELGHGCHGLLAIEKQGALMWHAPMAYAETASIFGEMVTFNYLLAQEKDKKKKIAMLMGKANDFMNSVVRQISFSLFEQRCHAQRRQGKLTVEQFNQIWMDVTVQLYGKDGDVFLYRDMDSLWCYVSHFMRPFYVYPYAFGELFTQSLFAVKDRFGSQFEPMYLDLLRAGGTKDAVSLMKPFGLDPTHKDFWLKGIRGSVSRWLDEVEALL